MSDTFIINNASTPLERRTSKSGKVRYTIRISSEPLIFKLDPKAAGKDLATAIAHHYRERVKGIASVAKASTLRAREIAQRAFREGKPWAMRQFSGGRTGPMEPNQTNREFNSSGRFRQSITANASRDNAWRINVAANRLNPALVGEAGVQRIWKRLVELVPEFGNPSLLMQNDVIKATVARASRNMMRKAQHTKVKLAITAVRSLFDSVRQINDIFSAA